jgi:hypothetical protein
MNTLPFICLVSVEFVVLAFHVKNSERDLLLRLARLIGLRNREVKKPGKGFKEGKNPGVAVSDYDFFHNNQSYGIPRNWVSRSRTEGTTFLGSSNPILGEFNLSIRLNLLIHSTQRVQLFQQRV